MFGILRILRDREAATLFDASQPDRAVQAATRQHDAHGALAVRLGERAKEDVDRNLPGRRPLGLRDVDLAVVHRELQRGINDVDMVGFEIDEAAHVRHRHRGRLGEEAGQVARVLGREIHDHDECDTSIPGMFRNNRVRASIQPADAAMPITANRGWLAGGFAAPMPEDVGRELIAETDASKEKSRSLVVPGLKAHPWHLSGFYVEQLLLEPPSRRSFHANPQ